MPESTTTAAASAPARSAKRGAWRRFIPWIVVAAIGVAIASGMRTKPLEIETATVQSGPLVVSVLEEGKTRIRHRYTISPPIAGSLNRIALRAGDPIVAGKTVLATIQPLPAAFLDPRSRAEAEARLKGAEAAKQQRDSQLQRARTALELAEKEMGRVKTLRGTGAVSARDFDAAENQADVLTREVNAAEFGLQMAEFERAQAAAVLDQDPKGEAAKSLDIVSPINGYVLQVFEESARAVTAGLALMEIGDIQDLEAEIEMLSSDAVGVQRGATASIEQWGGDRPLKGIVTLVEPGGFTKISALGVEEQRVKVRVDFAEPLPAGRTLGDRYRVEARIVTWQSDRVVQVPTGALFRRGADWTTFTVVNGHAKLTKVEIAHQNGVAAEVLSGLKEGDTVILHPPDSLTDGTVVKAKEKK